MSILILKLELAIRKIYHASNKKCFHNICQRSTSLQVHDRKIIFPLKRSSFRAIYWNGSGVKDHKRTQQRDTYFNEFSKLISAFVRVKGFGHHWKKRKRWGPCIPHFATEQCKPTDRLNSIFDHSFRDDLSRVICGRRAGHR